MKDEKLTSWYDKIEANIASAKNNLHIQVCCNMIAQFNLTYPSHCGKSLDLEMLLDKKNNQINSL